jgi:hypothetical protein
VNIPEPVLRTCLSSLQAYASHPDTPALHDPLYGLLTGGGEPDKQALATALVAHASHPCAARIREGMAPYITVDVPDLAAVLGRFGPIGDCTDLLGEVGRRLERSVSTQHVLRTRIQDLEQALGRSGRSANAAAALGAFILVFGLLGWAVALGWMEVQWISVPVPGDLGAAATGAGSPPAGDLAQPSR